MNITDFKPGDRVLDLVTEGIGIVTKLGTKYVHLQLRDSNLPPALRGANVRRVPDDLKPAPLHKPQALRSTRVHEHAPPFQPNRRARQAMRRAPLDRMGLRDPG